MKIRDRIKSLRRVKASDLLPNPKNWRRHPAEQQDAMRALLAEVGFAGAALARETKHGLQLIDGHLRAELSPDAKVPVLVLDVTEAEADKLLATFDPVGKLAKSDRASLGKLLAEIDTESEALEAMLAELEAEAGEPFSPDLAPETSEQPVTDDDVERSKDGLADQFKGDQELVAVICPACAHEFYVTPDTVVEQSNAEAAPAAGGTGGD